MTPDELAWARAYTSRNEGGARSIAYLDSAKIWTVGVGCCGPDPFNSPDPVIGPHTVWTPEQAALEFNRRHDAAIVAAALDLGAFLWTTISGVRQAALADLAYQCGGGNAKTGVGGLAGYHKMLAAVRAAKWQEAHDQWLNAQEARQTPARAARNAAIILTGQRPDLTF